MVNKISKLIIFLLINGTSFSQVEFISDWLGEWTTTYKVDNHKAEENLTIKLIHSERWIYFRNSGKIILDDSALNWTSSQFLTIDNELKVIGWYIDDNGYEGMSTLKGFLEDNCLILNEESQMSTGKSTWLLKDGKLYFKGVLKYKENGKTNTIEKTFIKKQE